MHMIRMDNGGKGIGKGKGKGRGGRHGRGKGNAGKGKHAGKGKWGYEKQPWTPPQSYGKGNWEGGFQLGTEDRRKFEVYPWPSRCRTSKQFGVLVTFDWILHSARRAIEK